MNKAIAPYRGAKVWNPAIDTAQLAKRVEVGPMPSNQARGANDKSPYRLDNLVTRYGIEVPERDTRGEDPFAHLREVVAFAEEWFAEQLRGPSGGAARFPGNAGCAGC